MALRREGSEEKLIEEICKDKKKHACSVHITCGFPSKDGKMKVEMTYEGDPTLAAYLLQNAQDFLEQSDPEISH